MADKIRIDLTPRKKKKCSGPGCKNAEIIIRGEGEEDFPLPPVDDLVERSFKRLRKLGKPARPSILGKPCSSGDASDSLLGFWEWLFPSTSVPKPTTPESRRLVQGAEGLQRIMARRQFDAIVEERFGSLAGAVSYARANMPRKYQKAVVSINRQLVAARAAYGEALPQLVGKLAAHQSDLSLGVLVQQAVSALDEELAELFFILRVYTDSFAQHRDGAYRRQLQAVTFLFDQEFQLFKTGDLHSSFGVGDVFLPRFTGLPLGTLPGSRGPVGAHALQLPYDLLDILVIQFPLLAHEFRHNIFSDVSGLEEQMTRAVEQAIRDAVAGGKVKLSAATIQIGKTKVPSVDLLVKFFCDCIGEIDADLAGGLLLSGPAFLYNMLMSFPAMLVQGRSVSKARQLLRTSSVYQMFTRQDGTQTLEFESHPPDYVRAHIVAAGLDEIGFGAQAAECRTLADFGAGSPVPAVITWQDAAGKSRTVVSIPVSDIKALAPVVARTIIRAKLPSLGNKSMGDRVMWTPQRQSKVETLTKLLLEGKTAVPSELGDVYASYFGAAATMAYWHRAGQDTGSREGAAREVNEAALSMLDPLRREFEAKAPV